MTGSYNLCHSCPNSFDLCFPPESPTSALLLLMKEKPEESGKGEPLQGWGTPRPWTDIAANEARERTLGDLGAEERRRK